MKYFSVGENKANPVQSNPPILIKTRMELKVALGNNGKVELTSIWEIFHLSSWNNHIWAYLLFLNISKFNSLKREERKVSRLMTKTACFSSVAQHAIHWLWGRETSPKSSDCLKHHPVVRGVITGQPPLLLHYSPRTGKAATSISENWTHRKATPPQPKGKTAKIET